MNIKRIVTGVLAVGVAAGAVLGATQYPEARHVVVPVPVVNADPAPLTLVCTGGIDRQIAQGLDVDQVDEKITTSSLLMARSESVKPTVSDENGNTVDVVGGLAFTHETRPLSGTFTTDPLLAEQLQWAGSTVHTAAAGDLRGTASVPCVTPTDDVWLVGSQSAVGTSNELVIANPTRTSVTVEIEALGGSGPLDLGSKKSVTLSPGATERVTLDGALETDPRIALHLHAESGSFAAVLQQNVLNGATPAGIAVVSPAALAHTVFVPAVHVADGTDASLRIVNPHTKDAEVNVALISADGTDDLPGATNVSVQAGTVMDLSLAGIAAGDYVISVSASENITAGVVDSVSADKGTDIAWASAGEHIRTGAAVIPDGTSTLTVAGTSSGGTSSLKVYPVSADGTQGKEIAATVAAGKSTAVALPEGTVGVFLYASDDVVAGISVVQDLPDGAGTGVDWVPLHSAAASGTAVRISLLP